MTHRLRFAARSDRGLLRSNNQDSVYAGDRLLIVADGMGGHAAGDLASRVVVAAFTPLDAEPPQADLLTILRRAMHDGNTSIAEMVAADPDLDGMGTTATAMLFDGDRVALAHIGDSRAYLYRNGVLHQLSHDDTFVQSLVDEGRITEEEAAHHPQRNLLLRALNGTEPDPLLSIREISTGDRFMICSDGLSSVVGADAIAEALADPDPDSSADQLIALALVAGGPDNVTVIVADVIDVGARASSPIPAGPVDPEATGPIQPIHQTQRMPRIALPDPNERSSAQPFDRDGAGYDGAGYRADGDDERSNGYDDGDSDCYDDGEGEGYDDGDGGDTDRAEAPDPTLTAAQHRRSVRRRWWILAAVVVVLAGLTTGAVLWTRAHYFVGTSDGKVVVFKGVQGSAFGLSLSTVQEDSCAGRTSGCSPMLTSDLQPSAQLQVQDGIPVTDLQKAREVIANLADQLLPYCDAVAGGTTGPAASSPTASSSPASTSVRTSAPGGLSGRMSPTTMVNTPTAGTGHSSTPTQAQRTPPVLTTGAKTGRLPRTVEPRPGDRLRGGAAFGPEFQPDTRPHVRSDAPDNAAAATAADPTASDAPNCRVRR